MRQSTKRFAILIKKEYVQKNIKTSVRLDTKTNVMKPTMMFKRNMLRKNVQIKILQFVTNIGNVQLPMYLFPIAMTKFGLTTWTLANTSKRVSAKMLPNIGQSKNRTKNVTKFPMMSAEMFLLIVVI